jgi:hypothetical protein
MQREARLRKEAFAKAGRRAADTLQTRTGFMTDRPKHLALISARPVGLASAKAFLEHGIPYEQPRPVASAAMDFVARPA